MTVTTATPGNDAGERLARRFRDLTTVLEGAGAERDLAVFLAHRRGLSAGAIANITGQHPNEVERVIVTYALDENADTYQEGPRWVQLWPHHR